MHRYMYHAFYTMIGSLWWMIWVLLFIARVEINVNRVLSTNVISALISGMFADLTSLVELWVNFMLRILRRESCQLFLVLEIYYK